MQALTRARANYNIDSIKRSCSAIVLKNWCNRRKSWGRPGSRILRFKTLCTKKMKTSKIEWSRACKMLEPQSCIVPSTKLTNSQMKPSVSKPSATKSRKREACTTNSTKPKARKNLIPSRIRSPCRGVQVMSRA